MAKERGIPVVFFNADDPTTKRDAYVGADNVEVGKSWANYLVENDLVEEGDFVWMPVEVPGATYQREETKGIASVFDPLGIEYDVFDAKYDPVQSLQNMKNYLSSHKKKVDAIIGLGDMVMGNMKEAFDAAGLEPGDIPVVGWGNSAETAKEVMDGYVQAATWQYPQSQGYMPIALLNIGYDIVTVALYEKENAESYYELAQQ
jgi:simple sugar transport system substrate-binding protein